MFAPIIGEGEKKRRSSVELRLGPYTTTVALDNPLHDCQSNAGPLIFLGKMESLKYAEQLVSIAHIKANAIVFDEIEGIPCRIIWLATDFNPWRPATGRIFHRV